MGPIKPKTISIYCSFKGPSQDGQRPDFVKILLAYTVKKVNDFPDPSRDVPNQTVPGPE
jgi:hypothetical protein